MNGIDVIPLHDRWPDFFIEPPPEHDWTLLQQGAWEAACRLNPKLFDAPIWSVADATATRLVVRHDAYKRLTVQEDPRIGDLGVVQLGVKGFITAGAEDHERLLLARRGHETRIYPGLWEVAPAGGVDVARSLDRHAMLDTLIKEAREEVGIDLATQRRIAPMALLIDPITPSVDVVLRVQMEATPLVSGRSWETSAVLWATRHQCHDAARSTVEPLAPPTEALLRAAGWL